MRKLLSFRHGVCFGARASSVARVLPFPTGYPLVCHTDASLSAHVRCGARYLSNTRVRELAEKYFRVGDMWGMLQAINADYERMEHERTGEGNKAKMFLDMVRACADPVAVLLHPLHAGLVSQKATLVV